jgi:hypothetical protein
MAAGRAQAPTTAMEGSIIMGISAGDGARGISPSAQTKGDSLLSLLHKGLCFRGAPRAFQVRTGMKRQGILARSADGTIAIRSRTIGIAAASVTGPSSAFVLTATVFHINLVVATSSLLSM